MRANAYMSRDGQAASSNRREAYKKGYRRKLRNLKRLGMQKDIGASPKDMGESLKQHVHKHRARAAAGAAIRVGFSVAVDAGVTKPGWVGKTLPELPNKPLCLEKLLTEYGLTLFPWDGRCVMAAPPSTTLAYLFAGLPAFC